MNTGRIRVKALRPGARMPERATEGATGFDLYACVDDELEVGQAPVRVPTGIAIETPDGLDVQIRPRSGLSAQGVMATLGTIDADYRGEVKVILVNLGQAPVSFARGDRIAQLVVAPVTRVRVELVDELPDSERGTGGFGSTGQ